MEKDTLSDARRHLGGKCQPTDGVKHVQDTVMAVDMERAAVLSGTHPLRDGTHHPHGTQDMVRMGMRQVQGRQAVRRDAGQFQLAQDAIATPGVNQEARAGSLHDKTSIVTAGDERIARAQHDKFTSVHRRQSLGIITTPRFFFPSIFTMSGRSKCT